jgi:hypothetical protein
MSREKKGRLIARLGGWFGDPPVPRVYAPARADPQFLAQATSPKAFVSDGRLLDDASPSHLFSHHRPDPEAVASERLPYPSDEERRRPFETGCLSLLAPDLAGGGWRWCFFEL